MSKILNVGICVLVATLLIGCALPQDKEAKAREEKEARRLAEYTGVVVDVRDCPRLMSPSVRIIDEKGNEIFGPLDVEQESNRFRGMFGRTETLVGAMHHERVGAKPLVVRPLGVRVVGQEIIVSKDDAHKLRIIKKRTDVFRAGRVVLVGAR